MSKYDELYNEMKAAMKSKDQQRVLLLRSLISNVKNATVNAGKDITDDAVMLCLKKALKETEQSIASFTQAGRNDDVAKLEADRAYLQSFLPKPMTAAELEDVVKHAISETGASSKKDMGKVIKVVMAKTAGAADGKTMSALVSSMLQVS